MILRELEVNLPIGIGTKNILSQVSEHIASIVRSDCIPLKFAILQSDLNKLKCIVSCLVLEGKSQYNIERDSSIFRYTKRKIQHNENFNVVFLIPTGIGADIGGHAGDASPAARLIASACDNLILHPNVVNASDINEMPVNSFYVEGSVISRLMMGTVGLIPSRSNKVLVLIDEHDDELFTNATINAINAARSSFGLTCHKVIKMDPKIHMSAKYTKYGTASGSIRGISRIFDILEEERDNYDAVAISSVIDVPEEYHQAYFDAKGAMVNPWGGVEAMLTHAISSLFNVPSAHSPMLENQEIANRDPGIVDPRMAAEAISLTFFESVLKGLFRSPRIVSGEDIHTNSKVISASDISCLVIPNGCVGLPTLAALDQGIKVIAVKENKNIMKNDITKLPWPDDQLYLVENYWEAAGVICALKDGIAPESVRRPLSQTLVETYGYASFKPREEQSDLSNQGILKELVS